jgi:hypothetical protein
VLQIISRGLSDPRVVLQDPWILLQDPRVGRRAPRVEVLGPCRERQIHWIVLRNTIHGTLDPRYLLQILGIWLQIMKNRTLDPRILQQISRVLQLDP